LSGGSGSFPGVVGGGIGAGDLDGSSRRNVQGDGLGFGSWVISAADGDVLLKSVLGLNVANTSSTNLLIPSTRKLKLSIGVTVQTSNGLTSGSLCRWPLGLLIPSWAGVGAEGVFGASSRDGGGDIADGRVSRAIVGGVLNTCPAIEA